MDNEERSLANAILRVKRGDHALLDIYVQDEPHRHTEVEELIRCLLTCPNAVRRLFLPRNGLPDSTGALIAQLVATSSTLRVLIVSSNLFTDITYYAIAEAVKHATYLPVLHLDGNSASDHAGIFNAFVRALRHTPHRPVVFNWRLFDVWSNEDTGRLGHAVRKLACCSMAERLYEAEKFF